MALEKLSEDLSDILSDSTALNISFEKLKEDTLLKIQKLKSD